MSRVTCRERAHAKMFLKGRNVFFLLHMLNKHSYVNSVSCVCVCACVCEAGRQGLCVCACVGGKERGRGCVCVCMCEGGGRQGLCV